MQCMQDGCTNKAVLLKVRGKEYQRNYCRKHLKKTDNSPVEASNSPKIEFICPRCGYPGTPKEEVKISVGTFPRIGETISENVFPPSAMSGLSEKCRGVLK